MTLNPIGVLQITGYMIQIGVYEALGDAEYPQTFNKVLFPPGGNNDLIQHIFIADIFQTFQRVMYGEVGVLGVHAEVILRGTAGQDLVFNSGLWWLCLKAGSSISCVVSASMG